MQARKLNPCLKRLKYSLYFSIFIDFIFHHVNNGEYNAINIIHHTIIPKADDFVAERVQVFCSFFIVFFLLQVLTAIQFDDEFLFDADKIGNVLANGVLPSKVDSQLVVADECPKFAFGGREFFAEFDGMGSGFWVASRWARHFVPSLALPKFDPRRAAARIWGGDGCV